MARFDLTDEEWAIIEPFLPPQGRGPERKDDRKTRQSTIATTDGASEVYGASFSKRLQRNVERLSSLSTLPS